jgi:signal transduction histidine kinase
LDQQLPRAETHADAEWRRLGLQEGGWNEDPDIALDAKTGTQLWRYNLPELDPQKEVGFQVNVHGRPLPLRLVIRDEVYRIGREALINAFHHSQAKAVEIELEYAARGLRLLT